MAKCEALTGSAVKGLKWNWIYTFLCRESMTRVTQGVKSQESVTSQQLRPSACFMFVHGTSILHTL